MIKLIHKLIYSIVSTVRPTLTKLFQKIQYNKWQKNYPVPTEEASIKSIQGGDIIYDKFINQSCNKKVIIFLHGYYGSKKEFTNMAVKDTKKEYDVITYDLYSKNSDKRQKYTYGELESEDLKTLIDAESKYTEVYLVGHSLGAATVVKYIDKYKNPRIKKVISIAIFENFEKALHKNSQAINKKVFSNIFLLNSKPIIERYIEKMQIKFDGIENKIIINNNIDKVVLIFGSKDERAPYFKTKAKTYIIPDVKHDTFFTKNIEITKKIINEEIEKQ